MRNPRSIPRQLTFLAAGLAGTATAILLAIMASLLPTGAHTSTAVRPAVRERAEAVVLPTVQIVAQRN